MPAVVTWTGAGSSALWSDAANWAGNDGPNNGDDLIFPTSTVRTSTTDDLADLSVNSISVDGSYTLSGAPGVRLTVAPSGSLPTGIVVGDTAGPVMLIMPELHIGGNATVVLPASGSASLRLLDANNILSGAGNLRVIGGDVVLGTSRSGSYTGTIDVQSGMLHTTGRPQFAALTLEPGAGLNIEGIDLTVANLSLQTSGTLPIVTGSPSSTLVLRGSSVTSPARLTMTGPGTMDLAVAGLIVSTNTVIDVVDPAAALRFVTSGGMLNGLGLLRKVGLGAFRIDAAGTAEYNGTVVIDTGRFVLGTDLRMESVQLAQAAEIELVGNSVLSVVAGTLDGRVVGQGRLNKVGTGSVVTLRSNDLSGGVSISQGVLSLTGPNAFRSVAVARDAIWNLDRFDAEVESLSGFGGKLFLGPGNLTITGDSSLIGFSGTIFGLGQITIREGASLGLLAGNYAELREMTVRGTLILGQTNDQIVFLNRAQVNLVADGSTTARLSVAPGADVWLGSLTGEGEVAGPGGTPGLPSSSTLRVGMNNRDTTFSGPIVGSGRVEKTGVGSWTLTSDRPNTFTGTLTARGGLLAVNGAAYANSQVLVESGSLSGTRIGSIRGTAGFGGVISPGGLGIGTLEVSGDVDLSQLGLDLDIAGPNPDQYDHFLVPNTAVSFGGLLPTIRLINGYSPALGTQFKVVEANRTSFIGPIELESNGFSFLVNNSGTALTLTVVRVPSRTTLNLSTSRAVIGEPVTLTATVATLNGGYVPSGTVTFRQNFNEVGQASLINGVATLRLTRLPLDYQNITAIYYGDRILTGSFDQKTISVAGVQTNTVLTPSVNVLSFGQEVTFTAKVTPWAPSVATVPGEVIFMINGIQRVTAPLIDGVARFSTTTLGIGAIDIEAAYTGTNGFSASNTQGTVDLVVNRAPVAFQLIASPSPSTLGQAIRLTATLSPTFDGAPAPTGRVRFRSAAVELGVADLIDGQAILTSDRLPVGQSEVVVDYLGDSFYQVATSATPVVQVVNPGSLSLNVVAGPSPSGFGQPVTLVASARPIMPANMALTGQIIFRVGTTLLGSAPVVNGLAQITTTGLAVGSNSITADYVGDPAYASATAVTSDSQVVLQAATSVTLASSSPLAMPSQEITFVATVGALFPGIGQPSGSVVFVVGATVLGVAPVVDGVARLTTSTLAERTYQVTAAYQGNANFAPASSPILTQSVSTLLPSSPATLTGLTASAASTTAGQILTFTATAAPSGPGLAPPSGSVLFLDGTQILGVADIVAGRASLAVALTGAGWTHTITARLLGVTTAAGSEPAKTAVDVAQAETRLDAIITPVRRRGGRLTGFVVTGMVAFATPGIGAPAGTVTFFINGRAYGSTILINGQATQFVRLVDGVSRRVRIRYEGDADRLGSVSRPIVVRRAALLVPVQSMRRPPTLLSSYHPTMLRTRLMGPSSESIRAY